MNKYFCGMKLNASCCTVDSFSSCLFTCLLWLVFGFQMVCSGGASGGGSGATGGEALVCRVAAVVPGTSEASARQALHVASGDYQGAVRFLKVEKLYRSA